MFSLIRGEPNVVIRWAGPLILAGMLLGVTASQLQLPGVITAVFAIGLGACGGSLRWWRHERGLWMLAGLFLFVNIAIYLLLMFGQARDLFRGAPRAEVGLMIDVSLGTMLLVSTVRFLWRVAKGNWSLVRDSGRT